MSILMVGATGVLGSQATLMLAKRGHKVAALVRGGGSHPKSAQLVTAGIQVVDGDLTRAESLRAAVMGHETVVCSATSMPTAANDGLRTVDHDGTLHLIEAAEAEGVKRFVYVSYSGNIRQDSPLETAKRDCENRLLGSRMEVVILRPSYFMEMWLSPALGFDPANGSVRAYGSGNAKVSYISYSNVADFMTAVAIGESEGKATILEVGGPEALSQLDAVRIFERELGKEVRVDHVPMEGLQAQHQSSDPLQQTFGALMLSYANGDVIKDAASVAERYRIQLSSVSAFASGFSLAAGRNTA